jgi:phosphoribosylformylglycinamidine synthase subunit PurQ / glutaminase
MKVGVMIFPGTNCEVETVRAFSLLDVNVDMFWHREEPTELDMIVIPGGFSYGDYLRSGRLASLSKGIMYLKDQISRGVKTLGICNGFQILCETKLLPGGLMRNNDNLFYCGMTSITDNNTDYYNIPVANKDGKYYCDSDDINVAYKYSTGEVAGIYSEHENILGMMPHPERAVESFHESQDGLKILQDFLNK